VKANAQLARRFKWWWRGDDNSFVVTPKGATKRNERFIQDETITFQCGPAKITKADEMRADFHFWKNGYESAAHSYELVRRLKPKLKLPPYPSLNGSQRSELIARVGKSGFTYTMRETTKAYHDCLDDPKWSFPTQFNLRATDSALREAFEHFIQEQRNLKRISGPPEIPPKNTVSWRWLEVWDVNDRGGESLTPSEHSMKSRAIQRAKTVLDSVLEALKQAEQQKYSALKSRKPKQKREFAPRFFNP
jgi:hypothetical protein